MIYPPSAGRDSNGANGVVAVITGTGTAGTLADRGALLDFTVESSAAGTIAFTFVSTSNSGAASLIALSKEE